MIFCSAAAATRIPKKPSQPTRPPFSTWDKRQQLQMTAFSHWLRTGLLQDHPVVRLFVCSPPCRKWPNTQENGCWLPPSDHIQSETLFQTRQDQGKEWMVQPVFCIVDAGSCKLRVRVSPLSFLTEKRFSTHPVLKRFGQGFLLVKFQLIHLSATCQFVLFSLPSYLMKSILMKLTVPLILWTQDAETR